ncbi:ATP-binding cassette domain-containing protein [Pseudoduganella violacea]|uniref:ABC-2 type transport system ATP-binding protein n=1 Tax=Pseudoduganella violacea TaxID=1715466 RepID=A0A7W5FUI9_9BURK|nr:ATP-binding cassette domain-containing protein [Pseudoduganella violacea]MBB3119213.1 ABC-2 type transport system ATP-binding protein [Pseudoduganella violacea]
MAACALSARQLCKRFPLKGSKQDSVALNGINLDIPSAALTALVGPDGAGKTTLLRLAAGLLQATSGSLHVLGIDVGRDPQAVQDRISYMPQRFGLYEDLSVQENLDLYADLHGVPRDVRQERFQRLLRMTDLARFTSRPAGKLSGGMKQKLGLACTLVRSPELLLLDEPTVGVDPLSRRELWQIVQQLVQDEQLSVLVSTSYMDEAERCAQVFVLHEGGILAQGEPDAIRRRADGLCFSAAPPPGMPARELQARLLDASGAIIDAVPEGGKVRFIGRGGTNHSSLLANAEVTPVAARLEDGFMMILRASDNPAASDKTATAPPRSSKVDEANEASTVIEVRDLVRKFGDFTAVASTSFSVRRGEIFGLLGPNGAGKTTTFRMLCGLLPASSGFLQVAGLNLRHARAQARQKIGYVAQKFALYGNLTVAENLAFFGGAYGLHGARLRERTREVLAQFQLNGQEERQSGLLPGGFKQRLAMAAGLLHEPEILFLDEPTSGADPLARREFWRRITALSQAGVTVVVTTHFMEEAEYCDRIVIQDAGRLLAIGTPAEVRRQAGDAANMEQAFIAIVESNRAGNGGHAAGAAP